MDIIDSHHHIWRQTDLKWLQGPMQPRIFGDYESIRRDYPIEEYLDDVASSGVTKSVYVQANWPNDQFEDEVRWVQETADRSGWPHGIVGYADMTLSDARPQLERLAAYPAMRGIRQQFHWHENPLYRFAASASMAEEPVVQDNIRKLSEFGWTFDLQLFAGQMKAAVGLARGLPGCHLHPAACGHARRPVGRGLGRMANRHACDGRNAECGQQAVGLWHLCASRRCRADQADYLRNRGDVWPGAMHVRFELPRLKRSGAPTRRWCRPTCPPSANLGDTAMQPNFPRYGRQKFTGSRTRKIRPRQSGEVGLKRLLMPLSHQRLLMTPPLMNRPA